MRNFINQTVQQDGSKTTVETDDSHTLSGLPKPEYWAVMERKEDGLMWRRLRGEAIKVIESIAVQEDGRRWLHVSVSKPSDKKMPTYDDLQEMRRLFVGEERECYMVFPPAERYVNFKPVLHVFCCLDAPQGVLPQFDGVAGVPIKTQIAGVPVYEMQEQRTV